MKGGTTNGFPENFAISEIPKKEISSLGRILVV